MVRSLQQKLHSQMVCASLPTHMLENMFFSPEIPAYVTFDKLVEAAANSPRPPRRPVPVPRPGPPPFRPSAPSEDEKHSRSDLPWHSASSDKLVRAAANSPRLTCKQIQVPANSHKKPTALEHCDASEPALVAQPSAPSSTEDEEEGYTSRPQIRRPRTTHRFSAFLGEDGCLNNHKGGVQTRRPSRSHRLKVTLKKALRRVKDFTKC